MALLSSRSNHNLCLWSQQASWSEGGSLQYQQEQELSPSKPSGRWEIRTQPVWSPPVWWALIINTTVLPDVESSHWRLHHHLSQTEKDEMGSLMLGS